MLARTAAKSRTAARSSRAVKRPGGRVTMPGSIGRCSRRHLPEPPSSTATRSCPNVRKVHQTRGALRLTPEPSYTTRSSESLRPSALIASANAAGFGSMCGRATERSLVASRSKKRAPGMWPAEYSLAGSRPLPGRYQEPSRTRRPGRPRLKASQSVETTAGSGRLTGSRAPCRRSCGPRAQHGPPPLRQAETRGRRSPSATHRPSIRAPPKRAPVIRPWWPRNGRSSAE